MFSALIRNRAIAFSPDDAGASGAGGPAVVEETDEVEQPEGGKPKDDKDGDETDNRPEWRKRLDALAEKKPPTGDDKAGAAAAGKGGKPSGDADDDEATPLLVKVPGRKAGEEDVEIPVDRAKMKELGLSAKDVRDRMGQLRNGYKRAAEVETERAEIAEGRRELDEIVTEMKERPTDFFLEHVDASQYAPLVNALIARMSDADFAKVVQKVALYDADGSRRRTDGSDSRDQQHQRKEERARTQTAEQKRDAYVKAVTVQINNVIPEDWPDDRSDEFFEYATFKLQQHAAKERARGNTKGIAPEEIPALLSSLGVLKHFDLDEPEAASPPRKPTSSPSSRNAPPARKPASGKPRDTAADLQERRDTRRNASTTPGGAGAAAASGPPKGQTFKERIAFIRDKFGVKK